LCAQFIPLLLAYKLFYIVQKKNTILLLWSGKGKVLQGLILAGFVELPITKKKQEERRRRRKEVTGFLIFIVALDS
jgi:hypothetical protein